MLLNTIITNTLNVFLAYGLRASGKLRTDRYNFTANDTWTNDKINIVVKNLENVTGFHIPVVSINARESKSKTENNTRHIFYSGNTPIPLRFKPLIKDNFNIFTERK